MSSLRTRHILLCEKVAADCWQLLNRGVEVNQLIVQNRLALAPIDLTPIQQTLLAAEVQLKNLEMKASIAA
jgi:hypothetical protein